MSARRRGGLGHWRRVSASYPSAPALNNRLPARRFGIGLGAEVFPERASEHLLGLKGMRACLGVAWG